MSTSLPPDATPATDTGPSATAGNRTRDRDTVSAFIRWVLDDHRRIDAIPLDAPFTFDDMRRLMGES